MRNLSSGERSGLEALCWLLHLHSVYVTLDEKTEEAPTRVLGLSKMRGQGGKVEQIRESWKGAASGAEAILGTQCSGSLEEKVI